MLSSFSSVPGRIDIIRTPTEVYVQRDCFCLLQMHIKEVNNSQGKIKAKSNSRDVPDGCMKKNTVSAKKTIVVSDNKHQNHHNLAEKLTDPQAKLPPSMSGNQACYYHCLHTLAKLPDRAVEEDDKKLYVSANGLPQPEIVDAKDIDSVEDTQEEVEEIEEGSDDGSSFFRAGKSLFNEKEIDGYFKKAE